MGLFRFNQFTVCDDQSTMKVGTDAVLLGAWADVTGAKRILDIGTGCGVIALMLAQRTDSTTTIDAIDIHPADVGQARSNVHTSPWPDKINVHHQALQTFFPETQYSLIISNPPFFSDSLLSPEMRRTQARHQVTLTATDLLDSVNRLLNPDGKFCVILPFYGSDAFENAARSYPLLCARMTRFFTRDGKPQERTLFEFRRPPVFRDENNLTLYQGEDQWTDEYQSLTGAYYLPK